MGGEITWLCIKDPTDPDVGKYIFTMKLYRDCDGTILSTGAVNINMWGTGAPLTTISCNFLGSTDISPVCNSINSGNIALNCQTNPVGAVEEYVYQSAPINLPGTPPVTGWHFTWDNCCRNGAIVNLLNSTGNPGFTLRASMFPYTDPTTGLVLPADPCFDSSPTFNESPKTIICSGYPFAYSHNASDPELDSIRYYWAQPLDDFVGTYDPDPANNNPAAIPFDGFFAGPPMYNYAFNQPIPGNVNIDPVSGEISYNSPISGNFATVIRVEAFKCGQLVAEIHRDIQAVLIACATMPGGAVNNPPDLTNPVGSQTWTQTFSPTGLPSFQCTVTAGELVQFDVIGQDLDLYNGVTPQEITMEISGGQMASDYVTTTACLNPPCATFMDSNGVIPPLISPTTVGGTFQWQTSCDHVSFDITCGRVSNLYMFSVKVFDDFCPAPAIRIATLMIYVEADNEMQFSKINPTCFGGDGEVSVTPSLSISQISWDAELFDFSGNLVASEIGVLGPSHTFQDLDQGSYLLRASGAGGCIVQDTVILDAPFNPLTIESNITDVSCYGGSDGRVAVLLENGVLPYTFYIDGVQNLDPPPYDSVFTGLGEGTYVITGLAADSCGIRDTVTISAPQFPLQVLSSNSVGVCDNSSTGSATAFGAGGTPTSFSATGSPIYNYEWFDDSWGSLGTSPVINNLSVGNYYLEITDANGCDEFIAISVVAPQLPLSISPQLFAVACKGDNSGSAVVFTGGGFSPYNYQWETLSGATLGSSNGIVDYDTLSGLTAGSYHLEVTDDNGCTEEITFNIQEPNTSLVIDSIKEVNGNICYGDNEGRAIVYVSGGQPFYSYAWDNFDFNNVADSLLGGWHDVVVTDTWGCSVKDSVFINDSSLIESSLNFGVVSCYNFTDGSLSVLSNGGIGPYTYFWSNGQSGLGLTNINNLSSGSYYLTTRDALGCVVIDSIDIPNPDPLYVTAQELLRVSCNGLSDGQAFAIGTGGTSPYNFSWSGTSQVGDSVNTLSAGVDTVTIVDDRGCTAIDTVVVNEPDPLLVITTNLVPAYCVGVNTASATASVSGGTLPYSYHWDDNPLAPQITSTAINLYAGVYTATVTDDRGCQNIAIADLSSVTSNMSLQIDPLVGTSTSISCYGANDASLIVSIASSSSSVGPYVYQWIGPSFTSSDSIATNLSAGLYSVTVTDINGCVVNASQQITEPSELRYNVLSTNSSSCLGACDGTISLDIVGGTAPYVGLVTDNTSGITLPPINISSSFDVLDLCTSSYTVHLKDANDCLGSLIGGGTDQAILSSAIPTTVAQIDPIVQSILCNGDSTGQLTVVNPQSSPYSYSWHDLNTGAVTLGDSLMNLPVGTYVLSALYTDSFPSCTTTDTITITQLWPISSTFNILDVDCNGNSTGQIHTLTSGGTAPYNYSWSHNSVINNDTITNLLAGTYTLTITDANLCQDEEVYIVGQPLPLQLNIDSTQTYILNPFTTGGVSPYGYIWMKDNSPLADIEVGVGNSYTVGSYGSYYAIVTDANGCTNTSNMITYTEPVVPGIANLQDFDINIYPNPFKEETTIDFGRVVDEVEIKLFDVLGKLLNDYYLQNIDKFVLFREEKVNGIYFIEVEIKGEKESIYKLVIED